MALTKLKSPGLDTNIDIAGTLDVTQATTFDGPIAVKGQNGVHEANSIRIGEEGSGAAQIRVYGPDASTNGSLTIRSSRSDGTNSIDTVFSSAGAATFAGRVGIGNSTPQSFTGNSSDNLVVGSGSGGEGITIYSATDNQGALSFADGTSGDAQYRGAISYNHTADRMDFRVGGTIIAAAIDSAGNVGIGTQSPSAPLHIKGGYPTVHIQRDHATNYSRLLLDNTGSDGAAIDGLGDGVGGVRFSTVTDGTASERMRILSDGAVIISDGTNWTKYVADANLQITNDTNAKLVLSNPGNATWSYSVGTNASLYINDESQSTVPMVINSSGQVGIGTTSPEDLLHLTSGGSGASSLAAAQFVLESSGSTNWIHFKNPNTQNSGLVWSDADATERAYIFYDHNQDRMYFKSDGTGNNLVLDGGKVGIGIGSPAAQLQVSFESRQGIGVGSTTGEGSYIWLDGASNGDGSGSDYSSLEHNSDGDLVFSVGSPSNTIAERMRITDDGKIGIGTSSPSDNLDVSGTTYFRSYADEAHKFGTGSAYGSANMSVYYSIAIGVNTAAGDYWKQYVWGSSGSKQLYFYDGDVQAVLSTAGVWTDASDERIKKDIVDIKYNGIDTVLACKPRSYKMKAGGEECIGFIAQEMLDVIPEVVHGGEVEDGEQRQYSLSYSQLTAVAFKAIQEQQALIKTLQEKVAALEAA